MLALAMAVGLALTPRPPQIVKSGEEAAYAAWLSAEMRAAAGSYAAKDCSSAAIEPLVSAPLQDVATRLHPEVVYWEEVARVSGCGPARVQQLIVIRNGDSWRGIRMAPGQSTAGPTLQKDMLRYVVMAGTIEARKAEPDCTGDAVLKNSHLVNTEQVGSHSTGQPWTERWTIHLCSADYGVDVGLTPTADGGTDIKVSVPGAMPAP